MQWMNEWMSILFFSLINYIQGRRQGINVWKHLLVFFNCKLTFFVLLLNSCRWYTFTCVISRDQTERVLCKMNKMNVTPEVLGRLKRLAASVAKTRKVTETDGGSENNGETNKKEAEPNAKQNEESETNSAASGNCTGNTTTITITSIEG